MQGGIYPYAYRPQGLVAVQVSAGSTCPWEQDSTAYSRNPQTHIREDANSDSIGLSGYSFVRYGPEIGGYWTRYHEGFQPPSAFLGRDDVQPASIEVPLATHDSWPDHVPMSDFSDQSHQYEQALNLSVSPTHTSTAVGYEASSPGSDEVPNKPFKCSGCDKRFALKQSVGRHYRKRHDPNKCQFSNDGCNFTWGGPYDYRHHLKGQHKLKNKDINKILGKTAESHCRATIAGRKPFPPPLFPLYTTD